MPLKNLFKKIFSSDVYDIEHLSWHLYDLEASSIIRGP